MLIYHQRGGGIIDTHSNTNKSKGLNNRRKSMRKTYKSVRERKKFPYPSIDVVGEGSKKSKVSRKKTKISKKNVQFLEGLGLKVKQKR